MTGNSVWIADCCAVATMGLLVTARLICGHVQPELGIPIATVLGGLLGWRERLQ